jgi:predicted methyltransferase
MMIFSHFQTTGLAKGNEQIKQTLSPDLGRTVLPVERTAMGWRFPNGEILSFDNILTINQQTNSCFLLKQGELQKVEAFSSQTNRYYSLMPTAKAPTMLISGIPMHRIKNTTPDQDTREKIKALGKPYGLILDTATGLGYTAIQAAKTADRVITIEFDPAVLEICRVNPWSQELFNNPKIQLIIGDSGDIAPIFPDATLSAIIHDPPMFNLAGHLYSQALYDTFYRVLKSHGRLFHYIGNPDSRTGATTTRGVVERLKKAGFSITPKPRAFGVLARK